MKIVAFEGQGGARLGVVEGDQAIDLQAVDANAPTELGEWLAKNNGDVKPLADLAKKAPASAHKPLASLTYRLPVGRPGKIVCLGLNYLEHVKEGPQRDNLPKFPTVFMRGATSLVAHGHPIIRPQVTETLDYEAEMILVDRQARQAFDGCQRAVLHRRLVMRQRRLDPRIPAQDNAMGHGQELRPHRRLRPLLRVRR